MDESLSARNVNLAQGFLCSKIQVINSSDHLHSTLQAQSILHMHLLITTVQRCVIVVRPTGFSEALEVSHYAQGERKFE